MDPNAALQTIRELQREIFDRDDAPVPKHLAYALANAVSDLDEWLSRGGFLPSAWDRGQS